MTGKINGHPQFGHGVPDVIAVKHLGELLDTWQARTLRLARGKTQAVLLSIIAHNYRDAMKTLLMAMYPGFTNITPPFLKSAGKIVRSGQVVADMVEKNYSVTRNSLLYDKLSDLEGDMRRLADEARLSDQDRVDMFDAVKRWIVCDFTKGPTGETLNGP